MCEYTQISLSISLECESYAKTKIFGKSCAVYNSGLNIKEDNVEDLTAKAVFTYLDRLNGGSDSKGWVYGRKLVVYELFKVIENVKGVKHINSICEDFDGYIETFKEKTVKELINLEKITIEVKKPNE